MNHFLNNGPRTNNHLEGDNTKMNTEMPSENLNIYQFIDLIKILEAEVFINYERREHSSNFYSKRRQIDVERDAKILNLKSNLSNSLSQTPFSQHLQIINQFIRAIAHLYHYEKVLTNDEDEQINLDTPTHKEYLQLHTYTPLQKI